VDSQLPRHTILNSNVSLGDVSLDSMETVFSSDDTFADLSDPVYQKLIESDVQSDDLVLQDICLGMHDANRKNVFFETNSRCKTQSPDPHNFELIEDWDFTMDRSESANSNFIESSPIEDDEDSIFGSPTENITNFIANELRYMNSRV